MAVFVATACINRQENVQPPSQPIPSLIMAVTPETLAAELEPAQTLSEAADQLADRLGINTDSILVRIQSRDCSVCKIDASGVEYPDLPVADAESRIEANDKLWLVVADLTCYYYYDAKTISPLACGYEQAAD